MSNEEKRNIYNNIQNLYNMDFNTWQEVLAMLYNLVADVEQKFEAFEQRFELMLGKEVTKAIKKMYEDGTLAEIINKEVFADLNNKIDEVEANILMTLTDYMGENNKKLEAINEQLDNKASKNTNFNIRKTLERLRTGKDTIIVLAGTSIGDGMTASSLENTYAHIVYKKIKERFPNTTLGYQNSSVPSTGSNYLRENWNDNVARHFPHLLIIEKSTNDTSLTDEEIINNYKFFYNEAKKIGCEVLIVGFSNPSWTPAPYGNNSDTFYDNRKKEIVELTRNIADNYGWGFVDVELALDSYMTEQGKTRGSTLLNKDHIHLNDLGHKIVASEILRPFLSEIPSFELDRRYGGKNFAISEQKTLLDLSNLIDRCNEFASYNINDQQITYGGLWINGKTSLNPTGETRLYGTQVVSGTEDFRGDYESYTWHVKPNTNDFIELEVDNPYMVWLGLTSSTETPVTFNIYVDGVLTDTTEIKKSRNEPIIIYTEQGYSTYDFIDKGKHKIRLERIGTIPPTDYVIFNGFLVQYHPVYNYVNEKNQVETLELLNRRTAIKNGVICSKNYNNVETGTFVQATKGEPYTISYNCYGTNIIGQFIETLAENILFIFVDDIYRTKINLKGSEGQIREITLFNGTQQEKHRLVIVSVGAECNLKKLQTT